MVLVTLPPIPHSVIHLPPKYHPFVNCLPQYRHSVNPTPPQYCFPPILALKVSNRLFLGYMWSQIPPFSQYIMLFLSSVPKAAVWGGSPVPHFTTNIPDLKCSYSLASQLPLTWFFWLFLQSSLSPSLNDNLILVTTPPLLVLLWAPVTTVLRVPLLPTVLCRGLLKGMLWCR